MIESEVIIELVSDLNQLKDKRDGAVEYVSNLSFIIERYKVILELVKDIAVKHMDHNDELVIVYDNENLHGRHFCTLKNNTSSGIDLEFSSQAQYTQSPETEIDEKERVKLKTYVEALYSIQSDYNFALKEIERAKCELKYTVDKINSLKRIFYNIIEANFPSNDIKGIRQPPDADFDGDVDKNGDFLIPDTDWDYQ